MIASHIEKGETRIFLWKSHAGSVGNPGCMYDWRSSQRHIKAPRPYATENEAVVAMGIMILINGSYVQLNALKPHIGFGPCECIGCFDLKSRLYIEPMFWSLLAILIKSVEGCLRACLLQKLTEAYFCKNFYTPQLALICSTEGSGGILPWKILKS